MYLRPQVGLKGAPLGPSCRLWARGLTVPLIHPGRPRGVQPRAPAGRGLRPGQVPPGRGGSSWALQTRRALG